MRFSISIPQLDATGFDRAAMRAYLARAEELGFEGGWTLEQVIGEAPLLAPLELLAFAAGCTGRLRLGVAVMLTSLHEPLQLASAVTAVDRISGGRLDLGVAAGGGSRPFAAFGVERATFVRRFTEGLELMRAAWSDEPRVTFHGRFQQVDDLAIQPKPVQRPHPPIWFGGRAPKALARAVRYGDGFIGAGSSTTADFAVQAAALGHELDAQAKDPTAFTIGKRVYLMVDEDGARARDRVLAGMGRIYGARLSGAEAMVIAGPAGEVADGLSKVIDAGAQMIVCNPVGTTVAEDLEQMERLATEVLPVLQ